jgi:hypothetical protein
MISYTGLILDDISKANLINRFGNLPSDWQLLCHHMTINMGKAMNPELLGKEFELTVNSIARTDNVIAVGVETELPSKNSIKHITVAINPSKGGKAKMSNDLTDWKTITPFKVSGTVQEIEFKTK